jgi:hypothetical protein
MSLKRWAVALILLGVLWRTGRYLLQFPIWGDEAFVCVNLLERGYAELLEPLRFNQVAPLLFLWGELAAFRTLGGSELALRLLPFLAGLGSLVLFWRLAQWTLTRRAAVIATGILAVAYYPVRHSCEVKPYAFDLLVAVALLILAVSWLRQPGRLLWPILSIGFLPIALGVSYPAVFIAGAVSVVLLPTVWRQPGWTAKLPYLIFNVIMVLSFLGYYWLAGLGQHASMDKTYWENSFPPTSGLSLLAWLCRIHTGNMFAYPLGGHTGASTPTFVLCLLGVYRLWRKRRGQLLLLACLPFALTLLAAALHRYPYGGSARVAQHLAPAICLLAGAGLAAIIGWMPSVILRWRWTFAVCGLLALIGAGGLARDVRKPYKSEDDRLVRQVVAELLGQARGEDQIVVMDPKTRVGPTFEWYLRRGGERISWSGQIDWQRFSAGRGQLWCLYFDHDHAGGELAFLHPAPGPPLTLVDCRERYLRLGTAEGKPEYFAVYHWVRNDATIWFGACPRPEGTSHVQRQ